MEKQIYNLDMPVLKIPDGVDHKQTYNWTLRQAVEGLQLFGGIGSGKTSSSGRMVALKYLSLNFGGLVLTAKTDEKTHWEELCRIAGRSNDLIIIEPGGKHYFNLMEHLAAGGEQQAFVENIVHVLNTVIRASNEKQGGGEDTMFWENALHMTMFNVITLCQLAYGEKITLQLIYDVAQSLPKKSEQGAAAPSAEQARNTAYARAFLKASARVDQLTKDFKATLSEAQKNLPKEQLDDLLEEGVPQLRRMNQLDNFFFEVLHNLSSRTRSVIDFCFLGFLFGLLQDPIYSLLCKHEATFKLTDCFEHGKIILINLPVKKFHKIGRDSQCMLKFLWQQAMESRDITQNERPVFLWGDESQLFLHEYDAEYQATARSSRIATVYISQNLPNYYANMGGDKSEYKVKSFLGTLGTKIFHANADMETNRYASELIGEAWQEEHQHGENVGNQQFGASKTSSWVLRKVVRPEQLVGLKTGGDHNKKIAVGYMHVQGKKFASGFNHTAVSFSQEFSP
ncbi:MAG TPA: TraM recognition domain-containing protein [Flavipsychrobacter sp.]|nr:TraM recognition domain-containing protein [Flavipsychrobacter sp.]